MASRDMIEQGKRRRREIALFIQSYIEERGFSPTMEEIGEAVGIASANAVHGHLVKMQEEGILSMQPRTPRSIHLLEEPEPVG